MVMICSVESQQNLYWLVFCPLQSSKTVPSDIDEINFLLNLLPNKPIPFSILVKIGLSVTTLVTGSLTCRYKGTQKNK